MVDYFRTVEACTSYLHNKKYLDISNMLIFSFKFEKNYHIIHKYYDKNTFYVIIFDKPGIAGIAPAGAPGPMGQTI